jgi:hypothetical protein
VPCQTRWVGGQYSGSFAFVLGSPSLSYSCKHESSSTILYSPLEISTMPETLRALVGNGSVTPPPINRPIIPLVGRRRNDFPPSPTPPKPRYKNPLPILFNVDILLLLIFNGMFAAVYFGVTASISTLFHEIYPFLNQTQLGLCFLTIGSGMIVGSTLSGRLLDWDFQRVKKLELAKRALEEKSSVAPDEDLGNFPLERVLPFSIVSCWQRALTGPP